MSELFEQNVKDAFFDFNKSDLRPDARQALTKTAEFPAVVSAGAGND
jgi:outer membrane protein OmpA-like peptidoglycan-associated protein